MSLVAVAENTHVEPVFAYTSAAVVLGIPLVGRLPSPPHVVHSEDSSRRSAHGVVRHHMRLEADDVTRYGGFLVTSLARTAIDLIASGTYVSGIVVADHVLGRVGGRGGVSRDDLRALVARRRPFRGVRRVDAVLSNATGLADSALESLLMARFDEHGFARPDQQVEFTRSGGRSALADFYWRDSDVIGEADGRVKYNDPAFRGGRSAEQVVWDEKVREDDLRAQCRRFVRFYWEDIWDAHSLRRKLRDAGVPRSR